MGHTVRDKRKLLNRVRRIRGQVEAAERAIEAERDCPDVMQLLAACRGALNGLLGEVLEEHVRGHVVGVKRAPGAAQAKAADELIDVIHSYFR